MSDVVSKSKRSAIMRAVKSSGNVSTELKLIKKFEELGITGWRRNYKLLGCPDFVFLDRRVIVFVDGCFWHGHSCRNLKPKKHALYWKRKIQRNKARDQVVTIKLKQKRWKTIRIWECELEKPMRKKLACLL